MPEIKAATIQIRPARFDEAEAITHCHIAAWRDSFRPQIAEQLLGISSLEEMTARWRGKLENVARHMLVAEDDDHGLIGFVHGGPERTQRTDFRGEIYGIYLLKEFRRQGIGRRLFEQFCEALLSNQLTSLIVWAFEENDCRAAYAAWGGQEVERGPINVGSQELIEVAYGWADVTCVAR